MTIQYTWSLTSALQSPGLNCSSYGHRSQYWNFLIVHPSTLHVELKKNENKKIGLLFRKLGHESVDRHDRDLSNFANETNLIIINGRLATIVTRIMYNTFQLGNLLQQQCDSNILCSLVLTAMRMRNSIEERQEERERENMLYPKFSIFKKNTF